MKNLNPGRMLILLLLPIISLGQVQNNEELKKMYEEDQSARMTDNIDWSVVRKSDRAREKRVYQLIDSGKVVTGKDYYHSAMIFQHGQDSVAYAMAVKQMRKAIEQDTTINKWLLAAAIDRELMSKNKPQIYGTQYVKKEQNAKWERYTIDTTKVTDTERKLYGVETLQEQLEKERNMNLLSVSDFFSKSKSLEKTIALINKEKKNGLKSAYNVSEGAINIFGYELMTAGNDKEALAIFMLNTELYPGGYNTFDSLGECLLKMGRKDESIKAYKKSLELNPKNEGARNILSKFY
jgi:tetratricopeptide (TPR) repeat protein